MDKLKEYFPFILKLSQSQVKKIMLERVLIDEDLIRLCQEDMIDL